MYVRASHPPREWKSFIREFVRRFALNAFAKRFSLYACNLSLRVSSSARWKRRVKIASFRVVIFRTLVSARDERRFHYSSVRSARPSYGRCVTFARWREAQRLSARVFRLRKHTHASGLRERVAPRRNAIESMHFLSLSLSLTGDCPNNIRFRSSRSCDTIENVNDTLR
jgi:hypothetical protein